jgi:peptidyl-prolyl cis-trans isomerase SurA
MHLRGKTFRRIRVLALAFAALGFVAVVEPHEADAAIVERIVAVVGERPILLSELRQRARPHLFRIQLSTQDPSQQAAQESGMFRDLLNRMIDERLEETAADKAHLTVTPEEVDNGIRQVAAQAKLSPKELVAEAKRQGLTEQDYRDEIRRQVLEGKLIQLRVRGRVRVTDQDARAAYGHLAKQIQLESPVDLKILALAIAPGSTQQQVDAQTTVANELARRARAGEDFCALIQQYSMDPTTKNTCGSRGPIPISQLNGELASAAKTLKPGEISEAIYFRDPMGNQAILVVQGGQQPKVPPFEEVREQMMERAFVEATDRQRRLWLQELRRGVYIDIRL